MAISLFDAAISARLTQAGLPAPVTIDEAAPAPPADTNYSSANVASAIASLSGYGQALVAASRFQDAFTPNPDPVISSNKAVATVGSTSSSAVPGTYALNVTRLASGQESRSSATVTDPAEVKFGKGKFTIQATNAAKPKTITITNGSLDGISSAINAANAGVTASVVQNGSNYTLSIKGNGVGANADGFTIASSATRRDSFRNGLAALGLSQFTAKGDAAFTVNGGAAQSSSSNNITIGGGINVSLAATGSSNVFFPKLVSSSNTQIATATSNDQAVSGDYVINVARTIDSEFRSSVYSVDPTAVQYGNGSFAIRSASADTATQVNVSNGSLNGIRDAINAANAGVTASVGSNSFGYFLSIKGNEGANGIEDFTINTVNDPSSTVLNNLTSLGLTQTQTAGPAEYTVNGGATQFATTRSVQLTNGPTVSLLSPGTTTVSVGQDTAGLTRTATNFVNNYNSLIGSLNALGTNDQALLLKTNLFNNFSALTAPQQTAIANLGITRDGLTSSDPLLLSTSTLSTFYSGADASTRAAAATALDTLVQSSKTTVAGFTGSTGSISTQATSTLSTITSDITTAINTTLAGAAPDTLPVSLSEALTQRILNVIGAQVPGLSTFA